MEIQITDSYIQKLSPVLQKRIRDKAQQLNITHCEAYWVIRDEDMNEDREELAILYSGKR